MPIGSQRRRFEPGTVLAWRVASDPGYRQPRTIDWEVEDITGKSPISLADAVGHRARAPQVSITPGSKRGLARIESESPLAVVEPDLERPHLAGRDVEVPLGTVARAGQILFAPLSKAQSEELAEGRLELRSIGDVLDDPEGGEAPLSVERAGNLGTVLVVVAAVLVLAGLLAGAYIAFGLGGRAIEADRVLVAARGFGTEGNAAARRELGRRLREAGLLVVGAGELHDLSSRPTVEELQQARRAAGAAHAVLIRSALVEERPSAPKAGRARRPPIFDHFLVAQVTAEVWSEGEPEHAEPSSILVRKEADERGVAMAAIAEEATEVLWPDVGATLVESATLSAYVAELRSMSERPPGAARLLETADASRAMRRAAAELRSQCDAGSRPLLATDGPSEVLCLSASCAEEFPVGLTPDGASAVVQVHTARPFHTLSDPPVLRFAETPHRIDLVRVADGRRQTLAYAARFTGSAVLSEDGNTLILAETSGPHVSVVRVDIRSGARSVLWSSWRNIPFGTNNRGLCPSPDGRRLASIGTVTVAGDGEGQWGALPRGEPGISVLEPRGESLGLPVGKARGLAWTRLYAPGHRGPALLLAVLLQGGAALWTGPELHTLEGAASPLPAAHVALVAPSRRLLLGRYGVGADGVRSILGVHEGSLVVAFGGDSCDSDSQPARRGLATIDPMTGEVRTTDVAPCFDDPVLAADGVVVATAAVTGQGDEAPDEPELVVLDLESGAVTPLTSNAVEEHSPRTARDSSLILFGRGAPGVARAHQLAVVCTANVGR